MKILLSLSVLLLFAACSSVRTPPPSGSPVSLIWPPAPQTPRIAYGRSLSTLADFGANSSAFTSIGKCLTGNGKSAGTLPKPLGLAPDENENLCLTDTG